MADLALIAEQSKASQGIKELHWLLQKVDTIKPKVIVEIGVHLGHSLKAWHDAFKPELLVGIDHEINETLVDYLASVHNGLTFLKADSHDHKTGELLVEVLSGREIDFLFIDGDHMYNGVKQDFEMYAPLVRKGGIIAYDDMDLFDNPSVEVYQFWNEVKGRWKSEQCHVDSNGIGIIYV